MCKATSRFVVFEKEGTIPGTINTVNAVLKAVHIDGDY